MALTPLPLSPYTRVSEVFRSDDERTEPKLDVSDDQVVTGRHTRSKCSDLRLLRSMIMGHSASQRDKDRFDLLRGRGGSLKRHNVVASDEGLLTVEYLGEAGHPDEAVQRVSGMDLPPKMRISGNEGLMGKVQQFVGEAANDERSLDQLGLDTAPSKLDEAVQGRSRILLGLRSAAGARSRAC